MKESLTQEELQSLELKLLYTAEYHPDISARNEAVSELRDKIDETYVMCSYCENKVVKAKDCCLENGKVVLL